MDRTFTVAQIVSAISVLSVILNAILTFFCYRWVKAAREGGFEALKQEVFKKLWEGSAAQFTPILDRSRDHLQRIVLSKDRKVAFLGSHPDQAYAERLIEDSGFTSRAVRPAEADVVVLFGMETIQAALKEDWIAGKALVLYTGSDRINAADQAEFQAKAVFVLANMPITCAIAVQTLAQVVVQHRAG